MSAKLKELPLYHRERGAELWKALRVVWLLDRKQGVTVRALAQEFRCAELTARRWLRVAAAVLPVEVVRVSGEDPQVYRLVKDWTARLGW